MKGSSYFFLVIMAVVLTFIVLSLGMVNLKSKLLPLLIGGAVFALAAGGLIGDIVGKDGRKVSSTMDSDRPESKQTWGKHLPIGLWIVGFFLGIILFGFLVAMPLFVLGYMKKNGVNWLPALSATVLTSAFIYVMFEVALNVVLYRGLVFSWVAS